MKNLVAVFAVILTTTNCWMFEDREDRRDCESAAAQRERQYDNSQAKLQNLWNQADQAQTATVAVEQMKIYGIQQPVNNQ